MIRGIGHILSSAATKLAPGLVPRLDHYLVTHWPLLWRTRLLWGAWYAALASTVTGFMGLLLPTSPAEVWSPDQINTVFAVLQLVCLGGIGLWAFLQLRIPLGERPLPEHLGVALLNVLIVVVLLAPAYVFVFAATYRMADALPEDVLQAEYELHREHGFWCCYPDLDSELVARHRGRLDDSLGRFGLHTDRTILPDGTSYTSRGDWVEFCQQPLPCLTIADVSGNLRPDLLRGRVESIYHSNRLWRHGNGSYLTTYVYGMQASIWIGVLVALIVGVLSHPSYAWRRRFLRTENRRRRLSFSLWLPAALQRMDQKLLRERPMFWATRMHVFLFHSLTFGVALAVLAMLMVPALSEKDIISALDDTFGQAPGRIGGVLLIGAVWPLLWAAARSGIYLPATSPRGWRAMSRSFLVAALPVPLIIWLVGMAFGAFPSRPDDVFYICLLLSVGACYVVSGCLTGNYLGRLITPSVVAIGLGCSLLPLFPLFLMEALGRTSSDAIRSAIVLSFVATWALLSWVVVPRMAGGRVSRGARFFAALLVMISPAIVAYGAIVLYEGGLASLSGYQRVGFTLPLLVLIYPFYLYGLSPLLRILVRARYEPQPD